MAQSYITGVMGTRSARVPQRLTDSDVIDLWLARQRSPLTRSVYRRDINRLLAVMTRRLEEITPLDLEQFAESLAASGLAPISQGRTLAAIRSFFRFADRVGYSGNPATGLELPRTEPFLSERIISQEDVRRMISLEPGDRNKVLLAVLYATGLRVSEACGLRWRNLQARGEAGQIIIYGKGGRTRIVLIPASVWSQFAVLNSNSGPNSPVFPSRSGKPLDRSRVRRIVRAAGRRAGITAAVTTHWLRHAHASHALDRGAPIHLVQATLGHRSVVTTSLYFHARPDESSAKSLG